MTIGEVLAPVMLPIAYGVAVFAVLLLIRHVARVYPSAPKRIPQGVELNGRPSKRLIGKWFLWLLPAILAITLVPLGLATFWLEPPPERVHTLITLIFVLIAQLAWYAAWQTDRMIEFARKMTYRVAPARTFRALLPVLATMVITIVVAIRS